MQYIRRLAKNKEQKNKIVINICQSFHALYFLLYYTHNKIRNIEETVDHQKSHTVSLGLTQDAGRLHSFPEAPEDNLSPCFY